MDMFRISSVAFGQKFSYACWASPGSLPNEAIMLSKGWNTEEELSYVLMKEEENWFGLYVFNQFIGVITTFLSRLQ